MRHSSTFVLVFVFALLGVVSFAQTKTSEKPTKPKSTGMPTAAATDSSSRLPVKRVVLYKNGVGYFEHTARAFMELKISASTSPLRS